VEVRAVVIWLRVLVLAVDIYLLASVAPWLLLVVLEWRLQHAADSPSECDRRLHLLRTETEDEDQFWPQAPRPGRYAELDRRASEALTRLHDLLHEATSLRPVLSTFRPTPLAPLDIARFRAWQPLLRNYSLWRHARQLRRLLDQGDDVLLHLQQGRQRVESIPTRLRAELNEVRAEIRRLQAVLEAEKEEAGTVGLEELAHHLDAVEADIAQMLDALSQATADAMPHVVLEADALLQRAAPDVHGLDEQITQAVSSRNQAENLIERLGSSLNLLEERLAGLIARGAREEAPGHELASLRADAKRVLQKANRRTVSAYHEIHADVAALDARMAALGEYLDALDDVMEQSRAAIQGDVQALAEAQHALTELARNEPCLVAERTASLIEDAAQSFAQAEEQQALGTIEGYRASLTLSEEAMQRLAEAREAIAALPERLATLRDLAGVASAPVLSEWRARAARVREQLQAYARHWNTEMAGSAGEALALLDTAETLIRSLAPGARQARRVRESEIEHATEILTQARDAIFVAGEHVEALEAELARIEALRAQLLEGLEELQEVAFPALQQAGRHMLPELRQRLNSLADALKEQVSLAADPAQLDHDRAVNAWLPSFRQQIEELDAEQARSRAHYAGLLRETIRRIDKQWTRLARLDPYDPPLPAEDVVRLAADLDAWRDTAERQADNPVALREILARHAPALEQRIVLAIEQITTGRRDLEALDRHYRKAAQNAHALRMRIRDLCAESAFANLTWETEEADRIWDEALEAERDCQTARTLLQACDHLQRAVNAALQAEGLYARVEHQLQSALRRLNDELRGVHGAISKARRQADALRERGEEEEAAEIERACDGAERGIELAYASGTFEEALRRLRDARDTVERG
jgi:hypothetical protein